MKNDNELILKCKEENDKSPIFIKYTPLLHYLCRKLQVKGQDYDDLFQEASIKLLECIDDFDPKKGVSFRTYAQSSISRLLKRYKAKNISYGGNLSERDSWKLSNLLHTNEEDMTIKDKSIINRLSSIANPLSFDYEYNNINLLNNLHDIIPDKNDDISELLLEEDLETVLTCREMRFIDYIKDEMNWKEVCEIENISRSLYFKIIGSVKSKIIKYLYE